ncbi:MAG: DUF3793 family protein [Lachnospiraceae bacterium]|nr:DUF3793 family protein [Lachnospiraceae bacterium]
MRQQNRKWLEEQMALQCAPLLAGLKLSNLLIIPETVEEELSEVLSGTEFCSYCLSWHGDKVIYLLYRSRELLEYLEEPEVQRLLGELDYASLDLRELLEVVSERYTAHLSGQAEFPHELGLLLGYPAIDVRGFMEHRGKDFLYSGYWKVYGNLKETLRLFQKFGKAREYFVRMVAAGYSIAEVVA